MTKTECHGCTYCQKPKAKSNTGAWCRTAKFLSRRLEAAYGGTTTGQTKQQDKFKIDKI